MSKKRTGKIKTNKGIHFGTVDTKINFIISSVISSYQTNDSWRDSLDGNVPMKCNFV